MQNYERVVFLESDRLYLRAIEEGDLSAAQRWVNDPETRRFLGRVTPLDAIAERNWHQGRSRSAHPGDIVFAVVLKEGDRYIGNIGLHGIDWINGVATTGAVIGEADCRNRGYGTEAKMLVLKYAFDELRLERIESKVLATNGRSLRALEKQGYAVEGVMRSKFVRDGCRVDEICLGLLREDFEAAYAEYNRLQQERKESAKEVSWRDIVMSGLKKLLRR